MKRKSFLSRQVTIVFVRTVQDYPTAAQLFVFHLAALAWILVCTCRVGWYCFTALGRKVERDVLDLLDALRVGLCWTGIWGRALVWAVVGV